MSLTITPGQTPVYQWLVEAKLTPNVQRNVERLAGSEDVRHVAVLPDIHLGRNVNNGCVAATVDLVYPEAVGGDIGCGYSAIALHGSPELLAKKETVQEILRRLYRLVPVLKQRDRPVWPARLDTPSLRAEPLIRESRREGAYQLGSLGSGNHFVEFQKDETDQVWILVHSGSRGMGQVITDFHLQRATTSTTGLHYLDMRNDAGSAYLHDMEWAIQYATVNRLTILGRAVEIMEAVCRVEADEASYLDCPHNFARRETHVGQTFLVHRKSANSARPEETAIIAGSAGTPSFIVRGRGDERALCSSSHGAGRLLSRTDARRRFSATEVRRQLEKVRFDDRALEGLRDEAPAAYRDIHKVLRAQRDLVRQERRLTPLLSFKYRDLRR